MVLGIFLIIVLAASVLWSWWFLALIPAILIFLGFMFYWFLRIFGGHLTYNGLFPKE